MASGAQGQFESALADRGEALAVGLGFILGDYLGNEDLVLSVVETPTTAAGQTPEGLPSQGILLTHRGTLAAPRDDAFVLGWFFDTGLKSQLIEIAGGEQHVGEKLNALGDELADQLATDKYVLEESASKDSSDLWADYLGAGSPPPTISWIRFAIAGLPGDSEELFLAWPQCVLERMFGPAEGMPAAPSPAPAEEPANAVTDDETAEQPAEIPTATEHSVAHVLPLGSRLNLRRLLQTEVPVIVTLATQNMPATRLLDLGPGSIIEFERACDEPLHLSVNNSPGRHWRGRQNWRSFWDQDHRDRATRGACGADGW